MLIVWLPSGGERDFVEAAKRLNRLKSTKFMRLYFAHYDANVSLVHLPISSPSLMLTPLVKQMFFKRPSRQKHVGHQLSFRPGLVGWCWDSRRLLH